MKETLVEYKEELVKSSTTTDIIDLEELTTKYNREATSVDC